MPDVRGAQRITVELPSPLRALLQLPDAPLALTVHAPVTIGAVLDVLEAQYPALQGTLRDPRTKQRRALVRFFACEEDWSHTAHDVALPDAVASGREPLLVVGAMAGG